MKITDLKLNGKKVRRAYIDGKLWLDFKNYIRVSPASLFLHKQNNNEADVDVESNTKWNVK